MPGRATAGRAARRLGAVALLAAAFSGLAALGGPAASAHPLGNYTVNLYSGLSVASGSIRVTYVLDMAEIPTFQERAAVDANGDGRLSPSERDAYAARKAASLLRGVTLSVDGRPVALRVASRSLVFLPGQAGMSTPVLYLRATFEAPAPRSGTVAYRDDNYPGRKGWREVTAGAEPGAALSGSTVPVASVSRELRSYPVDLLSTPLDVRSASFSFAPGAGSRARARPGGPAVSGAPIASGGGFAALVNRRLSPAVAAAVLGLALLFGAVHALGPGHGKTIMAAYLVGEGARARQVVRVGAAVSLMHTVSVLALGLVALYLSHLFPAETVYPWLGLATGVVVLALGSWLLATRARARRLGLDPWHGHTHGPAGDHVHAPDPARELVGVGASVHGAAVVAAGASAGDAAVAEASVGAAAVAAGAPTMGATLRPGPAGRRSGRGLAALAVSGGILPSPTALVVLVGAINLHRVGYGLALIAAFSVGLAAALIAVGLLALQARSLVSRRLGSRAGALLPLASAAVIAGAGVVLTIRAVLQLA
jgi:nickel/cobalt transporter (NicO) family protein